MNNTVVASGTGFSRKTLLLAAASSLIAGMIASEARAQDCDIRELEGAGNSTQVAQANFTCMTARLTATLARIEALESELEPFRRASGIVAAFDRSEEDACPRGWERFAPAGGRMIVGAGVNNNIDENGQSLTRYPALQDDANAAQGGAERHTLSEAEMPAHAHTLTNLRLAYEEAGEGVDGVTVGPSYSDGGAPGRLWVGGPPIKSVQNTDTKGAGSPHNNMPPFVALYYCRRR